MKKIIALIFGALVLFGFISSVQSDKLQEAISTIYVQVTEIMEGTGSLSN